MRKTFLVVAISGLIAAASLSSARAGVSAFGGVNFPTGNFNDGADTGWMVGGRLTTSLIPIVGLGGYAAYNRFSTGDQPLIGDSVGDKFDAWEFHALGEVGFLAWKGHLGLGVANFGDGINDRKTKFGWQVGVSAKVLVVEATLSFHQFDLGDGSANWVGLAAGVGF